MKSTLLVADIFGMLVEIILLYGVLFEVKEKSDKRKAYISLLCIILLSMFADSLTCINLHLIINNSLFTFIMLVDYIAPFLIFSVFQQYLYLHIKEKASVSKNFFRIGVLLGILFILPSIFCGLSEKLFIFSNGKYYTGEYYQGYLLSYVVLLAYSFFIILKNSKKLGVHDTIATCMFLTVPIIGIFLNLLNPSWSFSVSLLSLATLILHIMLNAERENSLIESEVSTKQKLHIDELTNLNNRMAFTEFCNNLKEENLGIIFADINGLKYVNDHYGHMEGDFYILEFAQLLNSHFRKEDLYRISGDEFYVLLPNIPYTTFLEKVYNLKTSINAQDVPMASVGHAYGKETEIFHLCEMAEKEMYIEKREFHEKFPSFTRLTHKDK